MSARPSPGREIAWLAVSGAALVFAYRPFSAPILAFVGLVPLLRFLDRPHTNRTVVLGSLAFATPYFLGTMGWLFLLARFTPAGALGAAGAFVLHLGTFAFFSGGMIVLGRSGRVPSLLAAPFLWVVSEHARSYADFDFTWTTLGYSLSGWPSLVQHADLVGVWGLSFWIVLVNALAAVGLSAERSIRARLAAALGILLALALPLAYGVMRTSSLRAELSSAPRVRVAVVQPNIAQHLKWDAAARDANLSVLNRVIRTAEEGHPDLVVAPEACLPLILPGDATRLPESVEGGGRPLLLGIVRGVGEKIPVEEGGVRGHRYARHRNSAVLASPDRSIVAIHDKATLVPMTEAIPFREVFGFILPYMRRQFGRFEAGEPARPIEVDAASGRVGIGALICFEVLHDREVRDLVGRGAQVLVNITNDAWFGRSNMASQHLGIAVLRAVETRRSVVRSANTGISALVDPLGNVSARTPLFEEAVLAGDVPVSGVRTVYSRIGDVTLWIAYLAVAVLLGRAVNASRR